VWAAPMPKAPVYRPPQIDAAVVRVDGRVRGADDCVLTLTVLAPEHVGLTIKPQPSLFWYQSRAVRGHFQLTISRSKRIEPVLDVTLDPPATDGIRRLRLADHGVNLEEGVEYQWSVAMIVDPGNRSRDILASGVIKRVPSPSTLTTRLSHAAAVDAPYIYADEGFWYDMVETLSDQIDQQPLDKGLHQVRGIVFMQGALKEAAMYEFREAGVKGAPGPTNSVPAKPLH
jgi:hypothetical protein